ncbi:protein DDI1 homolog 2 [Strongylocentrotus purpuratus]|uniref:Protein DDI1 homolog 2 n=1 Tax=Strongylocentrotus purpuratus TaxID=7668 RepID=A0A7M7NEA5_STRPU|nr:protein DDI1 homolog 2 [Strongylocentrotus purpuratus]
MKVSVANLEGALISLEVSPEIELENFKVLVEMEAELSSSQCVILYNGRPMLDMKKTLSGYGVADGDVLLLQPRMMMPPQNPQAPGQLPDFSNIRIPRPSAAPAPTGAGPSSGAVPRPGGGAIEEDPARLMEMLKSNPAERAILKERNPPLAEALDEGNLQKFTEVLGGQRKERAERERQRILLLNADPFDLNAQTKIAEAIRLQNVEANMETAMEHAPESFGQVVMLYIDCTVNGHPVKAFVDSGAQMTIMSQACAERCNIMRLVDKRWAGVAKGVGTQKIIGRVHLGQIQIGGIHLQSSFSILEDQPMDMLLGLDMLKRHQCCIDLKRNCLVIGTTGTETPFLSEADIPVVDRNSQGVPMDMREAEDRHLAEALAKSAAESDGPSTSGSGRILGSPSGSTPSPSSSSSSSAAASRMFPEADVKKLVDMGYLRDQVLEELRKNGGNVNKAMMGLFAKSVSVPKR